MSKVELSIALGTMIMAGTEVGLGLSDQEVADIEDYWQLRFPPDLRQMLQTVLPLMHPFPDWRSFRSRTLHDMFTWPVDSICFDVEHDRFWHETWESRPPVLEDALAVARQQLRKVPKLIPVYGHRYLPADPLEAGNPVFSVYQTDVIYYGSDLCKYLMTEFGAMPFQEAVADINKHIPFWSDLAEA